MASRRYYSIRTGKNLASSHYDLPVLLRLFKDLVHKFQNDCYFQEAFGYECVDEGSVPGTLGTEIEAQVFKKLKKTNLWPIQRKYEDYSEDDLFDMTELLFDYISKPVDGYFHSWNGCGWHYSTFDAEGGKQSFRNEINEILRDYNQGFELSVDGEILALPESGLEKLIQAPIPTYDPQNIEGRINSAILKFRRHRSSFDDRRDAIRDLADVLEFLRPKLKLVLTKSDESDLFNIANNFGIRHHNEAQKTEYDAAIWFSWIFYYYLATIHAAIRLIEKNEKTSKNL